MAEGEIRQLAYDATKDLGTGQVPTNASGTLVNLDTGAVVSGGATLGSPAITGNVISIRLAGITGGVTHELRIGFDHTNPRVSGEHSVKLHVVEGIA